MKKDKLTIWYLGSNAVGKTTQAALLHLILRDIYEPEFKSQVVEVREGDTVAYYTRVSPVSANLGIFHHELTTTDPNIKISACCGADTLQTKAQIILAYQAALADPEVIIITVDAIMATGQFIHFLANDESQLMTILLDCTENTNFKRLAQRRATRLGVDPSTVKITEKTRENLSRKLQNFRSTFHRSQYQSDISKTFSTDNLSIEDIFLSVFETILYETS